jgi:aspartate-semialdehyde dehydrogenase
LSHRLIFVCDTVGDAVTFLSDPSPGATTIDLTGAGYRDLGLPLAHDRFLPPVVRGPGSALAVPHSLSLVLAEILAPFHDGPGVVAASAVILQPAADFGVGAVDELRQQTVQLLNFGSPPVEHFGRQLAFNVIPGPYLSAGDSTVQDRIEPELARLLGLRPSALSVDMVAVPMFYGHGVSMQVTTREPVSPEALYTLLDAGEGLRAASDDRECTPMEINGRGGISVTAIRTDAGEGNRIRLWAAADAADSGSAVAAIRLARELGVL